MPWRITIPVRRPAQTRLILSKKTKKKKEEDSTNHEQEDYNQKKKSETDSETQPDDKIEEDSEQGQKDDSGSSEEDPEKSNSQSESSSNSDEAGRPSVKDDSAQSDKEQSDTSDHDDKDDKDNGKIKHLGCKLEGVNGNYEIEITFDEKENIPEGATIYAREVNPELSKDEKKSKENKGRPLTSERFVSKNDHESDSYDVQYGLDLEMTDIVLNTQFFDLWVENEKERLNLKYPVEVRLTYSPRLKPGDSGMQTCEAAKTV